MIQVRRLGGLGAALALVALITCTQVRGGPGKDREQEDFRKGGKDLEARKVADNNLEDDLAASKFATQPVVVYDTRGGDRDFGWTIKAPLKNDAAGRRNRDYLILVDTSASQHGGPLKLAHQLAEAVVKGMDGDDRVAIWTVNNNPKSLTKKGFLGKGDRELDEALKTLANEYPSGAANLKQTLTDAVSDNGFEKDRRRQQVILYMGDGMSVAGPIAADERADLCGKLVSRKITVFSVPLGIRFDPLNLHGLPNMTGGTVIRLKEGDGPKEFVKNFETALDVPVLYPQQAKFSDNVAEVFPTSLPPLRSDVPTLVVGRIKEKGKGKLACTITGYVKTREVKIDLSEEVPSSEPDNFFLATMLQQWRQRKDQPAILPGDRALASTQMHNVMAREELVAQAEWALEKNELAAAQRLYEQVTQLDPDSVDAGPVSTLSASCA
ncbi:MAG TPA: hypothetical protein VKD72_10060, partial [Gemmataceae bacterium]|nr:hypothetical protein [Gemmataceae bacterium]